MGLVTPAKKKQHINIRLVNEGIVKLKFLWNRTNGCPTSFVTSLYKRLSKLTIFPLLADKKAKRHVPRRACGSASILCRFRGDNNARSR